MAKFILFIIALFSITSHLQAQLLAFPGAEGWGRYSKGIDLRETPSGGNTTIARAIMGRFIPIKKSN